MERKNFQTMISARISAGEAMTRIMNVPEWWGITFSGSSQNKGDTFVVKMGEESFFNFAVTELIPGKRVVWLVTDCYMPWYSDKKEWANTKLIFDLSENKGVTTLTFTHEGLTPEIECYKDCETGWTHWIRTSLLSYFTTGRGEFKKRKLLSYTVPIEVKKSASVVFGHLINDVSKFWPEEVEGESKKLNDEFVFRTGNSHFSKNKVAELVPNEKLVWLVTESIRKTDNFSWTGTKMIFELTPRGDTTLLRFTYDGVILENEYDRLVQICDMVIKENLYNFLTNGEVV